MQTVLKERRLKGRRQLYVKWLWLPESMNEWIDADQVEQDFRKG